MALTASQHVGSQYSTNNNERKSQVGAAKMIASVVRPYMGDLTGPPSDLANYQSTTSVSNQNTANGNTRSRVSSISDGIDEKINVIDNEDSDSDDNLKYNKFNRLGQGGYDEGTSVAERSFNSNSLPSKASWNRTPSLQSFPSSFTPTSQFSSPTTVPPKFAIKSKLPKSLTGKSSQSQVKNGGNVSSSTTNHHQFELSNGANMNLGFQDMNSHLSWPTPSYNSRGQQDSILKFQSAVKFDSPLLTGDGNLTGYGSQSNIKREDSLSPFGDFRLKDVGYGGINSDANSTPPPPSMSAGMSSLLTDAATRGSSNGSQFNESLAADEPNQVNLSSKNGINKFNGKSGAAYNFNSSSDQIVNFFKYLDPISNSTVTLSKEPREDINHHGAEENLASSFDPSSSVRGLFNSSPTGASSPVRMFSSAEVADSDRLKPASSRVPSQPNDLNRNIASNSNNGILNENIQMEVVMNRLYSEVQPFMSRGFASEGPMYFSSTDASTDGIPLSQIQPNSSMFTNSNSTIAPLSSDIGGYYQNGYGGQPRPASSPLPLPGSGNVVGNMSAGPSSLRLGSSSYAELSPSNGRSQLFQDQKFVVSDNSPYKSNYSALSYAEQMVTGTSGIVARNEVHQMKQHNQHQQQQLQQQQHMGPFPVSNPAGVNYFWNSSSSSMNQPQAFTPSQIHSLNTANSNANPHSSSSTYESLEGKNHLSTSFGNRKRARPPRYRHNIGDDTDGSLIDEKDDPLSDKPSGFVRRRRGSAPTISTGSTKARRKFLGISDISELSFMGPGSSISSAVVDNGTRRGSMVGANLDYDADLDGRELDPLERAIGQLRKGGTGGRGSGLGLNGKRVQRFSNNDEDDDDEENVSDLDLAEKDESEGNYDDTDSDPDYVVGGRSGGGRKKRKLRKGAGLKGRNNNTTTQLPKKTHPLTQSTVNMNPNPNAGSNATTVLMTNASGMIIPPAEMFGVIGTMVFDNGKIIGTYNPTPLSDAKKDESVKGGGSKAGRGGRNSKSAAIVNPTPLPISRTGQFECIDCGRIFDKIHALRSHMRCHDERKFQCDQCSMSFKRNHDLKRHQRSRHDAEKPLLCKVCNRRFARADALRRHRFNKSSDPACREAPD